MKALILAALIAFQPSTSLVGVWNKIEGHNKVIMVLRANHAAVGVMIPDINMPKDGIVTWENYWRISDDNHLCFDSLDRDIYTCYLYTQRGDTLSMGKGTYIREK
jgi:hypothetical protein